MSHRTAPPEGLLMRYESPVFVGIMPHAPVLVPGVAGARGITADATMQAMALLSRKAMATSPQCLVLLSPHSPSRRNATGIWHTAPLHGSFADFGLDDSILLRLDKAFVDQLEQEAAARGLRTWRITRGLLDHGALVPLHYLTSAGWHGPTVVIGVGDLERPALRELGRAIALSGQDRRLLVIASGDMSHRLTPEAPYGYHQDGIRFDTTFLESLRSGSAAEATQIDRALCDTAAEDIVAVSCVALGCAGDQALGRTVLSYEGPFGVGYGVVVLHDANGDRERGSQMAGAEGLLPRAG